jgi:hypothetical protein
MLELLVLASVVLAGLLVLGFVGVVLGFVFWVIFLPFKILGWVLHGVAGVVMGAVLLPVLVVAGVLALGAGILALALPLAPVAALVFLLWWLMRRGRRSSTRATTP